MAVTYVIIYLNFDYGILNTWKESYLQFEEIIFWSTER